MKRAKTLFVEAESLDRRKISHRKIQCGHALGASLDELLKQAQVTALALHVPGSSPPPLHATGKAVRAIVMADGFNTIRRNGGFLPSGTLVLGASCPGEAA
jgi:hypothetical protein